MLFKNNLTFIFLIFSIFSFGLGNVLYLLWGYSPIYGSVLGFIFLLSATVFAFKRYKEKTKN
ncbi:hypothetical protein ABE28_024250 (plasmid) [Peribacillus muralis]|uniref:Uncharacterized protein n=1 Tax=Peribacillus muralis TaxID=264697 RepID=A0A1B3XW81_9BACI|nr:hypothetical protein ABE28_024250 [Peribacillus muralis]